MEGSETPALPRPWQPHAQFRNLRNCPRNKTGRQKVLAERDPVKIQTGDPWEGLGTPFRPAFLGPVADGCSREPAGASLAVGKCRGDDVAGKSRRGPGVMFCSSAGHPRALSSALSIGVGVTRQHLPERRGSRSTWIRDIL